MSDGAALFAPPRTVSSLEDCYFYHSMDLPGHGAITGEWDLRGREKDYFGNIDFAGKRVLEVGTASGHLCFWMERQGAEVVAYDLSENHDWDIVPYAHRDGTAYARAHKEHIRRLNNAWWYARERLRARAQVAYGTVYDLSEGLGRFDVVTLGSILLHLRDPFLALQRAASLAADTVVVTDVQLPPRDQAVAVLGKGRFLRFVPDARTGSPWGTWWQVPPDFIAEALAILGFPDIAFSFHRQRYRATEIELYTLVARRGGLPDPASDRGYRARQALEGYDLHGHIMQSIPGRHVLKHLVERIGRRLRLPMRGQRPR